MSLDRILSIEDDPDIRQILQLSLEAVGGLTACMCASAAEALETAEAFAPDLLLLDAMMPEVDGVGALVALREIPGLSKTPAVFLTARVSQSEVRQYLEMGAVGVVAKPFAPMELADRLRELWEEASDD